MANQYTFKAKCPKCGYSWDAKTAMKYYLNCPDCRSPVPIREETKKQSGGGLL